jgi:hypothetical protein
VAVTSCARPPPQPILIEIGKLRNGRTEAVLPQLGKLAKENPMKLVKWCFIPALVIAAAFAVVGASSATAALTVLCKVEESPCQAVPGHRWEHVPFEIKAEKLKFLAFSPTGELTCESSTAKGELLGTGTGAQEATLTTFAFANCKFGTTACEVSGIHLGPVDLLRTNVNLGEATFLKTEIFVQCGLIIHCVYGGTPALHLLGKNGAQAAMITAEGLVLKPVEGVLCPSETRLTALYSILVPLPAYISS